MFAAVSQNIANSLYKPGQAEHMPCHVNMGTSRADHKLPCTSMPTQAHAVQNRMYSHEITSSGDCRMGMPPMGRVILWPPKPMHWWYGMGMYVKLWRVHACMVKPMPGTPSTMQMNVS